MISRERKRKKEVEAKEEEKKRKECYGNRFNDKENVLAISATNDLGKTTVEEEEKEEKKEKEENSKKVFRSKVLGKAEKIKK